MTYQPHTYTKTVTIGAGASLSSACFLENFELCGIITPSGWDTAALTFQGSVDNTTFYNVWNGAAEAAYAAVTASIFVVFDPAIFLGIPYIKVRSGTGASAVNQADAVTVTLVMRQII
jgi:hypothetical protein